MYTETTRVRGKRHTSVSYASTINTKWSHEEADRLEDVDKDLKLAVLDAFAAPANLARHL